METSFVKVLSILLTCTCSLFAGSSVAQRKSSSDVYVRPYVKSNGTVVEGHIRSAPDKTAGNNFSTKGNVNPYTGEAGTVIAPSGSSFGTGSPSTLSPSQSVTTSSDVNALAARISKLEATVETLSKKIDTLIGKLSTTQAKPIAAKPTPSKPAVVVSKPKPVSNIVVGSKAAWRGLSRGMTKAQAKRLVGEPSRVDMDSDGELRWFFVATISTICFDSRGRIVSWIE
jgi:hypothetical protein